MVKREDGLEIWKRDVLFHFIMIIGKIKISIQEKSSAGQVKTTYSQMIL